ncbi:hypothetical protein BDR04DRAFT_1094389 [Suillus decipiens]|nr:hypothetical protein BDR04DRAFT_1094389 [Suillus decipiens]
MAATGHCKPLEQSKFLGKHCRYRGWNEQRMRWYLMWALVLAWIVVRGGFVTVAWYRD